jgi:four helix bundle protein
VSLEFERFGLRASGDDFSRPWRTLSAMQNYKNLSVWKKAHLAAVGAHRSSANIPARGNAELVNQIRRAAQSIPANIAEGCSRSSDADFAKSLRIAIGSASELEYHLEFAAELGLLERKESESRQQEVVEVRKMLFGLLKKIRPPGSS